MTKDMSHITDTIKNSLKCLWYDNKDDRGSTF